MTRDGVVREEESGFMGTGGWKARCSVYAFHLEKELAREMEC